MKLFKQYTGKTVASYLNDFRLGKAKGSYLRRIKFHYEIALDVGPNNTSYFIKSSTGNLDSPHKYRKNIIIT